MDLLTHLPTIAWYYLFANAVSLLLYAWDKSCALLQAQRRSERSLHLSALLSGGLGALAGQLLFRHKIRKPSFLLIALFSLIAHTAVILIT